MGRLASQAKRCQIRRDPCSVPRVYCISLSLTFVLRAPVLLFEGEPDDYRFIAAVFHFGFPQHRNVVEFIAWYATQNHIWIVEELCCGGSLAEVHATDARLPLAAIRQFGRDLMEGLRHVHG